MCCKFFIVYLSLQLADAVFYKTNLTDFSKCDVYYSRSGNVYKDFFELTNPPQENDSLLLDFHFSVLAYSDAHILLAPSDDLEKDDPAYEIVIGAGGNTFSDIRRKQKNAVKASVRDKGLLSALDPKSFWIHLTQDGVLEVGKDGEELAFLTWTDPDPLPLRVFSFSTWPGIEAKWFFNCPREDDSTSHIQEQKKNLTDLERLRKDLLTSYNPYVRPVKNQNDPTTIYMTIVTQKLSLDERRSMFEMTGFTKMSWKDEKISWNSSEYGGLEKLHIFRREIWQPSLHLINSVESATNMIFDNTMMIVNSSGHVLWYPKLHFKAWVSLNDKGYWPKDQHDCDLYFTFLVEHDFIKLKFDKGWSNFLTPESGEWELLQIYMVSHQDLYNDTKKHVTPAVRVNYKIRRMSKTYDILYFTPFVFVVIALLSTFWVSPFAQLKISLGCIPLIVSSIMLMGLAMAMPTGYRVVPKIVSQYSYSIVASLIAMTIATLVINLTRNPPPLDLPFWMCRILQSRTLRIIFTCPDIKGNDDYNKISFDESLNRIAVQQMMWILLGVAIDRIAFLFYLGLAIYAFCS